VSQKTSNGARGRLSVGVSLLALASVLAASALMQSRSIQDGVRPERVAEAGSNTPQRASTVLQAPPFELDDWMARAEGSSRWPIPEGSRLPGGPVDAVLADNPEEWLLKLPLAQQPAAQIFLERNAEAYAFTTKAEQAWMIENGFPTLEEAAFFAGLPRSQTCGLSVDEIRLGLSRPCLNPKLAALSADVYLREIADSIAKLNSGTTAVEIGDSLSVAPAAAEAILLKSEAEALLARESVGAFRFYQLARLVRELAPVSDGSDGRADVALALAYACEGDSRVAGDRRPELWKNPVTQGAQLALQFLGQDLRRPSGSPACGSARRAFPDRAP